ncbi:hypothetical protein T01_2399 [Trichinella spiralis]|uniref:Uncharacterized protein n=1 Tax=Trichinella spiralis TaxID=6334 RepID=A0A0V1C0R0_TRISP|nr:hypothetical protein T01_2399 [Trichinella spiralis]
MMLATVFFGRFAFAYYDLFFHSYLSILSIEGVAVGCRLFEHLSNRMRFQGPLWQHLDSLVDSGGSSCRLWRPFTRNASIFTDFMIGHAN